MADSLIHPIPAEASTLATRFARGEPDALAEVMSTYAPRVAALVFRLMGYRGGVDDMVQDVFVAALEARSRFRGDSSLWTWLTAITLHRCRAHHRRQRLRRVAFGWLASREPHAASDRPAIEQEISAKVRQAVADLPWRDRELIVLSYFEERSPEEISRLLKRKVGTVAVQLHRARERLRGSLPPAIWET